MINKIKECSHLDAEMIKYINYRAEFDSQLLEKLNMKDIDSAIERIDKQKFSRDKDKIKTQIITYMLMKINQTKR